jgi:hypothetical protein
VQFRIKVNTAIKHSIILSVKEQLLVSPEHREFEEALTQARSLADKIRAMRCLVDEHRVKHWAVLRPLLKRQADLKRAITLSLDERLELGALGAKQQRLIKRLICSAAKQFALLGDEAMRALHDKHSDQTLADLEKEQAAETKAYFEQMMGESLDDEDSFDSVDDVLHASIERMRKQAQAREQAKEKRKRKANKSNNTSKLELIAQDGQTALRTIYRQLASALHPDREADPSLRKVKTELMSEANTAYGRADLLALLQLQAQANLDSEQVIADLANEKIAALAVLIRERITALHRELRDFEIETVAEFVLPSALSIKAGTLKSHLAKQQRDLQSTISALKSDMVEMTTTAGLKRWLREQEMYE